jgi:micrococcal nuclease
MRPILCLILCSSLAGCGYGGSPTEAAPADLAPGDATSVGSTGTDPSPSEHLLPDRGTESLEPNATIKRVVDGDTVVVEVQGQTESVRLIGIDTPESVAENRPDQCYGRESSSYLSALLPAGTAVTLIRDVEARDRYDRLLAYVVRSPDGLFVNLDLVARGYAGLLTYEPNDHYADVFETAANDAEDAGLGLWGVCGGPDVPLG